MSEINVVEASSFLQQSIGLMFRRDFHGEMKFVFKKPRSVLIHTLFMCFPINVKCYDEEGRLSRDVDMKPWRFIYVKGVKSVVERKIKGGI